MIADCEASGSDGRAVVIVDDDPDVRDSLIILLEAHGFLVRAHSCAGEFLADTQSRGARCLVVDYHMPDMNGLDAIDSLRKEGIVRPTILITGRIDPILAARAADLGVTAVLEKPFATVRLVRLLYDAADQDQ